MSEDPNTEPNTSQSDPSAQQNSSAASAASQPGNAQQAAGAMPQQAYNMPPYTYVYAPASATAPAKKTGKGTWIVLGIILFAIVFVFTIGSLSCAQAVSTLSSGTTSLSATSSDLSTTGDTIAVIDIDSTIQYDGTACSPEGLRDLLQEAEDDSDIKAVVLRVNSGGGVATAGEEMAAYVREFSKPVVVSSASTNCSAAYEISSQADYIFVNETTSIGAIGTAMQFQDISELLDLLGISIDNITSADSKDSTYGTRALTDEEREYYQNLVDEINETFIQNVAEGRGMTVEEVEELATGMQFSGTTAVENGLADEIGIYDDALDKAAELGGIEGDSYDVVNLTSTSTDLSSLMDLLGSDSGDVDLSQLSAEDLLELLKEEGVLS